eukprot:TRINITY_DN352_c4_g1_i1.p1 TRINITY_DN352_c4_g1~~TRINITY_DN352_c4_g1_i1.p1  ORF type:complete len:3355 (-),score=688.04 TRINITY_DN352_c4_g1_i1:19-10083(-)
MLKELASRVLNAILADYVVGFEKNITQFSLSGDIKLENVKIKPSVLDRFYLPVTLKDGRVGEITLSVPWTNLSTQSTHISLKHLYFLISPKDPNQKYEGEDKQEIKRKMEKLEMAEAMRQSRQEGQNHSDDSFSASLATKIVTNLHVHIQYLHIRYEDNLTCSEPFSCGLTLEELILDTSKESFEIKATKFNLNKIDAESTPKKSASKSSITYKNGILRNMGIYWNSNDKNFINENFDESMLSYIQQNSTNSPLQFILPPISCDLKLILNSEKKPMMEIPKVEACLTLPKVDLQLNEKQYTDSIILLDRWDAWRIGFKYRKIRPTCSPTENPLAWWKFAYEAIKLKVNKKCSQWKSDVIAKRIKDKEDYVNNYKKQKSGVTMDISEVKVLHDLHQRLSFEDILYFRTLAEVQIKREKTSVSKQNSGWFGGWFGYGSNPSAGQITSTAQNVVQQASEDEIKELFSALELNVQGLEPPPTWIKYLLHFELSSGSISLMKMNKSKGNHTNDVTFVKLCELNFTRLRSDLAVRHTWQSIQISLDRLSLSDTTNESFFPEIISPIDSFYDESSPLFKVSAEIKPLPPDEPSVVSSSSEDTTDKQQDSPTQLDYDLEMTMKPLNIFYNQHYVKKLVKFFEEPVKLIKDNDYAPPPPPPQESIPSSKDDKELWYQYLLQHQQTFRLSLNLHAPNIIILEDFKDKTSCAMAVVLGQLHVATKLAGESNANYNNDRSNNSNSNNNNDNISSDSSKSLSETDLGDELALYDNFKISMNSIQVILTSGEKINQVINHTTKKILSETKRKSGSNIASYEDSNVLDEFVDLDNNIHFVEPFNMDFDLQLCRINMVSKSKLILNGTLPSLKFNISPTPYKDFSKMSGIILQGIANMSSSSSSSSSSTASSSTSNDSQIKNSTDIYSIKMQELNEEDAYMNKIIDIQTSQKKKSESVKNVVTANFTVPSTTIMLCQDPSSTSPIPTAVALISFKGLVLESVVTPSDMNIRGILSDFIIEDLNQTNGEQYRYILRSSDEGDDLVRFDYLSTPKNSPNYVDVERHVKLLFGDLDIYSNRETLSNIIYIILKMISSDDQQENEMKEKLKKRVRDEFDRLRINSNDQTKDNHEGDLDSNKKLVVEQSSYPIQLFHDEDDKHMTYRFEMNFKSVKLYLNDEGSVIAYAELTNSLIIADMNNSFIKIHGYLGNLLLTDNLRFSRHNQIVDIKGDRIVDFVYYIIPHHISVLKKISDFYPNVDTEYILDMRVNSMKFLWVHAYVLELLNYKDEFMSILAKAKNSHFMTDPTTIESINIQKYRIFCDKPIIVFPTHEKEEIVTLNLGSIVLSNSYQLVMEHSKIQETINIIMNGGTASKAVLNCEVSQDWRDEKSYIDLKTVLRDCQFDIQIKRPYFRYPTDMINPKTIEDQNRTDDDVTDQNQIIVSNSNSNSNIVVDHDPDFLIVVNSPKLNFVLTPSTAITVLNVWKNNFNFEPSKKQVDRVIHYNQVYSKTNIIDHSIEKVDFLFDSNFDEIVFDIMSDTPNNEKHNPNYPLEGVPLVLFSASKARASLSTTTREITTSTLDVSDVRFVDNRKDSTVDDTLKAFVKPIGGGSNTLNVNLVQSATSSKLRCNLSNLHYLAISGLLLNLLDITTAVSSHFSSVLAYRSTIQKKYDPSYGAITTDDSQSLRGMDIDLEIKNQKVVLVQNSTIPVSPAIIIDINADLKYFIYPGKTAFNFDLKHVQVARTTIGSGSSPLTIVSPFSATLNSRSDIKIHKYDLYSRDIKLIVSYNDVKLLNSIIQQYVLKRDVNKEENKEESDDDDENQEEDEEKPALLEIDPVPQLFQASLVGMDVIILDDVLGMNMPFFKFNILSFDTEMRDWSKPNLDLNLSILGNVDFYNEYLEVWEPFAEKLFLKIMGSSNVYSFNIPEHININISKPFLTLSQSILTRWNDDWTPKKREKEESKDESERFESLAPFYVKNLTGQIMNIYFPPLEKQLFYPDQSAPLNLNINTSGDRTRDRRREINISVEFENGMSIKNLTLDLGKHRGTDIIIYEVSNLRGGKLITFMSKFIVKNGTRIPMEILITPSVDINNLDKKPSPPISLGPLITAEILSVPVDLCRDASLRFRPANSDYPWSEPPVFLNDLKHGSYSVHNIQHPNMAGYQPPFSFMLATNRAEDQLQRRCRNQNMITITPWLLIENCLCSSMKYVIESPEKTAQILTLPVEDDEDDEEDRLRSKPTDCVELYRSRLERGGIDHIHQLPPVNHLKIKIHIKGYVGYSKAVDIMNKKMKDNEKHDGEFDEQNVTLIDEAGKKLVLRMSNCVKNNIRTISFYSPYWIINKSGLPLTFYSGEDKSITAPGQVSLMKELDSLPHKFFEGEPRDIYFEDFTGNSPLMFSFTHSTGSQKLYVKVAKSSFSPALNLAAQRSSTFLGVFDEFVPKKPRRQFELAVDISPAKNKFWRTKVVKIRPRYTLANLTGKTLMCKQEGVDQLPFTVFPQEKIPFHWPSAGHRKRIRIRYMEEDCTWSGPFSLDMSNASLRMKNSKFHEKHFFARALIHIQAKGRTEITISQENERHPFYRIDNRLKVPIKIRQKIPPKMMNQTNENTHIFDEMQRVLQWNVLNPDSKMTWAWDYPDQNHTVELFVGDLSKQFNIQFDKVKTHDVVEYRTDLGLTKTAYIRVQMQGLVRVLLLTHSDEELEYDKEKTRMELVMSGLGISLIDDTPTELLYFSIEQFHTVYTSYYKKKHTFSIIIGNFQVDNQAVRRPYPILFSRATSPPEFLKLSFAYTKETQIIILDMFSMLLKEIEISLDEDTLLRLLTFIDITQDSLDKSDEKLVLRDASHNMSHEQSLIVMGSAQTEAQIQASGISDVKESKESMIYVKFLYINPISVRITFKANRVANYEVEDANMSKKEKQNNTASILLAVPQGLLPNVERAPLIFNGFLFEHLMTSSSDIGQRLFRTYQNQLLSQVYTILGSAEFLGSPISFMHNLGDGVKDFFYEPAKGIAVSPEEFVKGVGKGSLSLVKNSLFGLIGSVSKITGSLGSGVAFLSWDEDYQEQRMQLKQKQSSNVVTGLGNGIFELVSGVVGGVTGIIAEPIKGAQQEGGTGFLKGLGRGLLGVVVKPTVGVFDLASRTTEGIKNTPDMFEKKIKPKRLPRHFPYDNILLPFSLKEALGKKQLAKLADRRYEKRQYHCHFDNIYYNNRRCVMYITDHMIVVQDNPNVWHIHFNALTDVKSLMADRNQIVPHRSSTPQLAKASSKKSTHIKNTPPESNLSITTTNTTNTTATTTTPTSTSTPTTPESTSRKFNKKQSIIASAPPLRKSDSSLQRDLSMAVEITVNVNYNISIITFFAIEAETIAKSIISSWKMWEQ